MKISEIAKHLNGKIENLTEDIDIKRLRSLENAEEGDITFLASQKYLKIALKTKASAIITKNTIDINIPQIIVDKPDEAFYKLIEIFYPDEEFKPYISNKATIGKNVTIGKDVYIGDYVVVEDNVSIGDGTKIYPLTYIGKNCKIGNNSIIYSRVSIYPNSIIGSNVILHSGVVIGGDGFGYFQKDGKHIKIKHVGKVIIEDNVEIGANTTIDRAMVDETVIGKGTKIDNLVMIGHNCVIGKNCIIIGQSGMAGSSKLEDNVIVAGQVAISDHVTIGTNSIIIGKSTVQKSLPPNGIYGGAIPAMEWSKWKKIIAYLKKLALKVK
ncbi:UDP-3-O-(3-hydroxymyristoyl)glucosamine N-acyltransferase [Persephonella sp.]